MPIIPDAIENSGFSLLHYELLRSELYLLLDYGEAGDPFCVEWPGVDDGVCVSNRVM